MVEYLLLRHMCRQVLPPGTDIPAAFIGGSDEEQAFVQNLALFLTSYFKVRLCLAAHPEP